MLSGKRPRRSSARFESLVDSGLDRLEELLEAEPRCRWRRKEFRNWSRFQAERPIGRGGRRRLGAEEVVSARSFEGSSAPAWAQIFEEFAEGLCQWIIRIASRLIGDANNGFFHLQCEFQRPLLILDDRFESAD